MMTEDVRRTINDTNNRMVTVITDRSPHEEVKEGTRSSIVRSRVINKSENVVRAERGWVTS